MSMTKKIQHFVRCDACGREHGDGSAPSALTARINAGMDGWKHAQGYTDLGIKQIQNPRGQRAFDWCDKCEDPRPRIAKASTEGGATS